MNLFSPEWKNIHSFVHVTDKSTSNGKNSHGGSLEFDVILEMYTWKETREENSSGRSFIARHKHHPSP